MEFPTSPLSGDEDPCLTSKALATTFNALLTSEKAYLVSPTPYDESSEESEVRYIQYRLKRRALGTMKGPLHLEAPNVVIPTQLDDNSSLPPPPLTPLIHPLIPTRCLLPPNSL